MMYHCWNCGRAVKRSRHHCQHCGARVYSGGRGRHYAKNNGLDKPSFRLTMKRKLRIKMGVTP